VCVFVLFGNSGFLAGFGEMASAVVGVVKPVAFSLPSSKLQPVLHQLNKQSSLFLPPLPLRKHPRKTSVSATLKSEGFWTPSSFDSHVVWSIRCCVLSQNSLFFFPGFQICREAHS
jgi:hypothetical protein